MCLTTTTVQGCDKDSGSIGINEAQRDGYNERGIKMIKEFDWDEEKRNSK